MKWKPNRWLEFLGNTVDAKPVLSYFRMNQCHVSLKLCFFHIFTPFADHFQYRKSCNKRWHSFRGRCFTLTRNTCIVQHSNCDLYFKIPFFWYDQYESVKNVEGTDWFDQIYILFGSFVSYILPGCFLRIWSANVLFCVYFWLQIIHRNSWPHSLTCARSCETVMYLTVRQSKHWYRISSSVNK